MPDDQPELPPSIHELISRYEDDERGDFNARIQEAIAKRQADSDAKQASGIRQELEREFFEFDRSLDNTKEIGLKLMNLGQPFQFHLRRVVHRDPVLLFFIGELEDGSPIQVVQHVSQINFVMMILPRKNPNEPKMGFHVIKEDREREKNGNA